MQTDGETVDWVCLSQKQKSATTTNVLYLIEKIAFEWHDYVEHKISIKIDGPK